MSSAVWVLISGRSIRGYFLHHYKLHSDSLAHWYISPNDKFYSNTYFNFFKKSWRAAGPQAYWRITYIPRLHSLETASCRSASQSKRYHMYESAFQVGRHLTQHSGRDKTLSDNTIFIAVKLFSADIKVTTTSVNDHTFSECENILEARNGIRLLSLICLFLYKIRSCT